MTSVWRERAIAFLVGLGFVAAGVSQPTVSRWERGELSPSLDEMRRIRDLAKTRGVDWDDSWLFEAA